ncbi:hypothetical protein [Streptomyces sp. NPDC053728]|uniref:hypothetical protein n=1 Tax=Streptomyces sp. NPDC053728 TaxID=3155534 RepID=UPI00341362EC
MGVVQPGDDRVAGGVHDNGVGGRRVQFRDRADGGDPAVLDQDRTGVEDGPAALAGQDEPLRISVRG